MFSHLLASIKQLFNFSESSSLWVYILKCLGKYLQRPGSFDTSS